jgi:hypothetical protein
LSVIDTQTLLRLVFGAAGASAYLVLALVVLRAEGARAVRAALFAAAALSALGLIMDSPVGEAVKRSQPGLDLTLRFLAAGRAGKPLAGPDGAVPRPQGSPGPGADRAGADRGRGPRPIC